MVKLVKGIIILVFVFKYGVIVVVDLCVSMGNYICMFVCWMFLISELEICCICYIDFYVFLFKLLLKSSFLFFDRIMEIYFWLVFLSDGLWVC